MHYAKKLPTKIRQRKRIDKGYICDICGQSIWKSMNVDGTDHKTTCFRKKGYEPKYKKGDKLIVFWQKVISAYKITKDADMKTGYYYLKLLWYKDKETGELYEGTSYKKKSIRVLDKYANIMTEMDEMLYGD